MWAQGCREAEIWDEFERRLAGQVEVTEVDEIPLIAEASKPEKQHSPVAKPNSKQLLIDNWAALNWNPRLTFLGHSVPFGTLGEIDIVAADLVSNRVVLIELQADREDVEVLETLDYYLDQMRANSQGFAIGGIIVARSKSHRWQIARRSGIAVCQLEVTKVVRFASPSPDVFRLLLKRLN